MPPKRTPTSCDAPEPEQSRLMLKFFWPARALALTEARSTLPIGTVMVPPEEPTEQVDVISSPVISSVSADTDGAATARRERDSRRSVRDMTVL
ncbi:hypothetical protein D3C71_2046330 [compost metagenome]